MSIVLNECEWAKKALASKELGKKPFETLSRIAKYYFYIGMNKKEVRAKLEDFLLESDPSISVVTWSNTLDHAVKNAAKYNIIIVDNVQITQPEMDTIDAITCKQLRGKQLQRLAFTLLCLSKFYYAISEKMNYWVSAPDNDIMKMANINTSVKRQSILYNQLNELGLIRFSKKVDNLNVQVQFVQDGPVVMTVDDFRNLGYQYLMYHGEAYYKCQNCGLTCKRNTTPIGNTAVRGGVKKYCDECAASIHMKQIVNSVMRKRSANF